MRVSWKWLSEMVDLSSVGGPRGLAELLTNRGLEVEEVRSLAHGLEKVITAQILERGAHPNSDRLSLCRVSTGRGEPLEIVCGAQNMKSGDKVALAQIGAELPNGMKIGESKIRGVASHGMLCSEEELKLAENSEGILILPADTQLGLPLAEALGLDDTILTLKLTANRGDCLSHFGLAREVAAALGQKPRRPKARALEFAPAGKAQGSPISIHLDAGESAPQFWGCAIDGVKVGPSPDWVVARLEALGSRSINNVVDASNLLMLELGHPVHVYDATKIEGGEIHVRMSKKGEKLPLLDGTEVETEGTELVIADGKRAIGLAGVMGGGNSEVQDGTTRVFLECAEFAPTLVRRASSRHQKKTEAAHRFERGIDPAGARFAIERLATLVQELAGGTVKGASSATLPGAGEERRRIRLKPAFVGEFLGLAIEPARIEKILADLECKVAKSGDTWEVTPPSYRRDLNLREDLAEEVARTIGYEEIPSTIPRITSAPTPTFGDASSAARVQIESAKRALVKAGLTETINFAFTSRALLESLGFGWANARVLNPISEECEVLVPSLLPHLIHNALENWRHHFGSEALPIRLFELRPTFEVSAAVGAAGEIRAQGEMETGVAENWKLSFAISGPRFAGGLRVEQGEFDFLDFKAILELLFEELGSRGIRYQPVTASRNPKDPVIQLLHPGQSVEILAGNQVAGHVGLLHPGKARALKARAPLWIGELDWSAVSKLSRSPADARPFKSWNEFPPMERDFALLVSEKITADKITQVALKAGKPLAKVAKIFDVYRGSQVTEGMTSVAVRVIFFEEGRSLQEAETEAASAQILSAWKKELGAELRG